MYRHINRSPYYPSHSAKCSIIKVIHVVSRLLFSEFKRQYNVKNIFKIIWNYGNCKSINVI